MEMLNHTECVQLFKRLQKFAKSACNGFRIMYDLHTFVIFQIIVIFILVSQLIFIRVSHQLKNHTWIKSFIIYQPVRPTLGRRYTVGFLDFVGIPPVGNDFQHFLMVFYMITISLNMVEEVISVRQLQFTQVALVFDKLAATIKIFLIIGSIFIDVTFVRCFMTELATYFFIGTMLVLGEVLANNQFSPMHFQVFTHPQLECKSFITNLTFEGSARPCISIKCFSRPEFFINVVSHSVYFFTCTFGLIGFGFSVFSSSLDYPHQFQFPKLSYKDFWIHCSP